MRQSLRINQYLNEVLSIRAQECVIAALAWPNCRYLNEVLSIRAQESRSIRSMAPAISYLNEVLSIRAQEYDHRPDTSNGESLPQ